MPDFKAAQAAVGKLFSGALSSNCFEKWRAGLIGDLAEILDRYAFGEIFWRKALGRPHTPSLSEGFEIEAWHDEWVLVGTPGGAAHWQVLQAPYSPSWWDGQSDDEYWRVSFLVPNLVQGHSIDGEHDEHTHVVPSIRRAVWWTCHGGPFGVAAAGMRKLEPPAAIFVKGEGGVHLSFEVVVSLFIP